MPAMQKSIFAVCCLLAASLAAQQNPSVESVIERVGTNVEEMQTTLPDFTCSEKAVKSLNSTFRLRLPPGISPSQTTESIVTTRRVSRGGRSLFVASRQVQSVSGRNGMVDLENTFTDDLARAFAKENHGSMNYTLARRQNLRGIPTLVVEFATRTGRASTGRGAILVSATHRGMGVKGKGWIDSNSMQVLRLEFEEKLPAQFHVPNSPLFTMKTTVDYGPVRIVDKEFWLLTKMVKDDRGSEWILEYKNCRRFEVTSEIRPAF
jgi:hypothetical protein